MTWNTGEHVELELTGFSHDGRAVARAQDQPVVFTQGGLPGQRVLVELVTVKKRMAEGITQKVLAPVPPEQGGERPAPCIHADSCGGCPWQAMPYADQLRWKRQLVLDSLNRIGKLDIPEADVPPVLSVCTDNPAREWGYRNKMEFAFGSQSGKPVLGLRRRGTHEIIEVTDCLLQSRRAMDAVATLRTLVAKSGLRVWETEKPSEPVTPKSTTKVGDPQKPKSAAKSSEATKAKSTAKAVETVKAGGLRFAVIRELAGSENTPASCLVELITGAGDAAFNASIHALGLALLEGKGVTGFVHSVREAESDVAYGEKTVQALGETWLVESLKLIGHAEPVRFSLGHNAFFQVNSAATEMLYNTAVTMALGNVAQGSGANAHPKGTLWDVYCGVGGLALALAPHFERVLGLESVPQAVALARRNAKPFEQCRFETADAARLGEYFRRYSAPDWLSVDPPRAGMDASAVKAVLQAKPRRLLMVSCNPATLARDLALLMPVYKIDAIQPIDLFPQTPHVECVVTLTLV